MGKLIYLSSFVYQSSSEGEESLLSPLLTQDFSNNNKTHKYIPRFFSSSEANYDCI